MTTSTQASRAVQSARAPATPYLRQQPVRADRAPDDSARSLYFALTSASADAAVLAASRRYLDNAVQDVAGLDCDLPRDSAGLEAWIEDNTARVGQRYEAYRAARKAGGPRQYFTTKAHALYFLKSVAPTKTVDGAWLYGLVRHWDDARFGSLIRIYLEELGNGLPDKNHVVLYKKLLATHGCEKWDNLSDPHFVQGAIQLALARNAEHFLPEIIGFNLGYEQLPLHLLITSYELNELGIDPYYFSLHVTVDNADTGHAKNALTGLRDAWPVVGDARRFYERVRNGYMLNALGAGTNAVIASFDLKEELIAVLTAKSGAGKRVHSDYCRVAGRSVNEWLSDPAQIPAFLEKLEQGGWIKRHDDPANSRFWQLLQGDRADMFGVFSGYELQVIHDWIAGDTATAQSPADGVRPAQRPLSFRAQQKQLALLSQRAAGEAVPVVATPMQHAANSDGTDQLSDFDQEGRQLDATLRCLQSHSEAMDYLGALMSPAHHHTAAGLKATRLFTRMLG